nr:LamB/YcsF family protein [Lonsdalea britannica]
MIKHIDLNSDMGEDFGTWVINGNIDREIMPLISSANIATGFHAGDPTVMRKTIELAKYYGVEIGAHPGYRDLMGFGRRYIAMQPDELVNDIVYQLGALRELARLYHVELQHIKPHGALYMHLAKEEARRSVLLKPCIGSRRIYCCTACMAPPYGEQPSPYNIL